MFRKIILLGITAVLLSGCASTVKIEKGGLPGPNHMIIANLPSNGIRLNIGLVHHFRVEEGKEYLETFEYLNPSIEEHRITCGNTKEIILNIDIFNEPKNHYQLWVYQELYAFNKTKTFKNSEIIYKGTLSFKEVVINLPVHIGSWGKTYFELRDEKGNIMYQSPLIKYIMHSSDVI
jgi:hypothetical protein